MTTTTMTKTRTTTVRRALLGLVAALGIAAAGLTALPVSDAAARPCNLDDDVYSEHPNHPFDIYCRS
jgi:hypothetical protein